MNVKLTVMLASMVVALGTATAVSWQALQRRAVEPAQIKEAEESRTPASAAAIQKSMSEVQASAESGPVESAQAGTRTLRPGSAAATVDLHGIEDLRAVYPDLAAELGISQSDADDFLRLLARQRVATGELVGSLSPAGASGREQLLRQMRKKMRIDEEEQASVLGGRYSLWQEAQANATAQIQARELTRLARSDGAWGEGDARRFTAAMAEQVAKVNAEFQDRLHSRSAYEPAVALSIREQMRRETDARTLAAAASYLPPTQLERFKQALISRERRAKYMLGELR